MHLGLGVVVHGVISSGFNLSGMIMNIRQKHIAVKEMIPILIAAFIWGLQLHGKKSYIQL